MLSVRGGRGRSLICRNKEVRTEDILTLSGGPREDFSGSVTAVSVVTVAHSSVTAPEVSVVQEVFVPVRSLSLPD